MNSPWTPQVASSISNNQLWYIGAVDSEEKKLRLDEILLISSRPLFVTGSLSQRCWPMFFYYYLLEYKKGAIWHFHLNVRKHLFTVRLTELWHWFPTEEVESPSLEILQSHMILGNLLKQGARPDHLQRSFPTLAILWPCKFCFSTFHLKVDKDLLLDSLYPLALSAWCRLVLYFVFLCYRRTERVLLAEDLMLWLSCYLFCGVRLLCITW